MSIYEMTVGFGYVVSMQMESIKLKKKPVSNE